MKLIPSAIRHQTPAIAKTFHEIRQRHLDAFRCVGEGEPVDYRRCSLNITLRTTEARLQNLKKNYVEDVQPLVFGTLGVLALFAVGALAIADVGTSVSLSAALAGNLGIVLFVVVLAALSLGVIAKTEVELQRYQADHDRALAATKGDPELLELLAARVQLRKEHGALEQRIRAEFADFVKEEGGLDLYIESWFETAQPEVYFDPYEEVFSKSFEAYLSFMTKSVKGSDGEEVFRFDILLYAREQDKAAGLPVTLRDDYEQAADRAIERLTKEKAAEEKNRKAAAIAVYAEHKEVDEDAAVFLAARAGDGIDS